MHVPLLCFCALACDSGGNNVVVPPCSGANQIELADGRIIKLEKLSAMERAGKAKLLLSNPGIKVHRHLIDGDVLLVNRQPTLHKPGIMAHKARVLRHVKEQTLRMHYSNCNTYNADFDGDEMNCHFVQSELARAEANYICNTDNQYIGPTSGTPLRGLIQDHVASAVKLTCKDTFLTKAEYQQLLYIAVSGLPGTEIVTPMEVRAYTHYLSYPFCFPAHYVECSSAC
jgi:DNA-directed RNA polymerase I subunit RPA1